MPTGYAIPTFTLLGQSVIRLPFIIDTSLGHEVLHSWFGNAIRVEPNSGNWCEGLTTYLADHAFAADKNNDIQYRKNVIIKYQSYVNVDNAISLEEFTGSGPRYSRSQLTKRAVGYGKASMVFHMLHNKFGEKLFIQSLQNFYTRMNGEIANWYDLKISFENTTGSNLDQFFEQWLTRNDVPSITINMPKLVEKDGHPQLAFTIHQESTEPYQLDIPIKIDIKDKSIAKTIRVTDKETPVSIPLDFPPNTLTIDPEYSLMRRLVSSELPPVWSRFLGAEKKLAVLGSLKNQEHFAPMIQYLEAHNTEIVTEEDVTDQQLTDSSVIFLGLTGKIARGLFGQIATAPVGFTIDVRKNPLNHDHVAVLASAANQNEVSKGIKKLKHYGKYSFLRFDNGRSINKEITTSDQGQQYIIDEPPVGIKTRSTLNFDQIINDINRKRIVYIGESHTRYEDHKLQLRVIRELFNNSSKIAIGMEMFPRSAQKSLDRYINGEIDESTFLKESNYFTFWRYDYRLYREILNFARKNKIPIIGLNADKETVSKIYKEGGISSLPPEAKQKIPVDRVLDMPNYRERIGAVFSFHPNHGGKGQFGNFLQSQVMWDETMAESIANYLKKNYDKKMVVLAGKAHVVKANAIPPRVNRRLRVSQTIITNAEEGAVYPEEQDFVIFHPPVKLPPKVLIGITMTEDKKNKSVVIDGLSPHGGAKKSGVKKDDIILALDGEPISSIEDVKIIMLFKEKGNKLTLDIRRPHTFFPDEEIRFEIEL